MTLLSDPVRFRKNLSKLVALIILPLMIIPSIPFPAHAQPSYLPGVVQGDTVTFGQVSGNIAPFNVSTSLVVTITSVVGVNVGVSLTFTLVNGTSRTQNGVVNVQTQQGNSSILVIAGGLSVGEPLSATSSSSSGFGGVVTETVTRAYAGALRPTNVFAFSQTNSGQTSSFAISWDQSTGLLVEISENSIGGGPSGQNLFAHAKATSTNVWTSSVVSDFGFDAVPLTNPSFFVGQSASYTLNLTSFQNFSGQIALTPSTSNSSLANPPTLTLGQSSVNVASNGFATTTLAFSTNSLTKLGTYLFTVHGVSGSLAHDASFAVFVQPASFQVISTPSNLTIAGGTTSSATITAKSLGAFSGTIFLTASSNNPGVTASLNQTEVLLTPIISSANSTLSVSVGAYTLPGSYSIFVSANSGTNQQSVTVPVTVSGPQFQLSLNTTSLTVPAGKSASVSINLKSISGFSGTVGLTDSSNGPAAISLSQTNLFVPVGGSVSSLLTIFVAPSASPGSFIFVSVTGISGLQQTTQYLGVNVPGTSPGFSINSNQYSLTISPGKTGNFTISLTSNNGFAGDVALGAQFYGSPMGFVFNSTSLHLSAGGTASSRLTVSAPTTFPQGSSGLSVYANSGNVSNALFLSVNVGTPSTPIGGPGFEVFSSPQSLTLRPGTSGNSTITVVGLSGFAGNLNLTATIFGSLCPGSSCPTISLGAKSLRVSTNGQNGTTLSITVPSTTPTQSSFIVDIFATNGTQASGSSVSINVCPCPKFEVSFNTNGLTIIQGTTVTPTVIISSIDGFTGPVTLHFNLFGEQCPTVGCPSVSLVPTRVSVPANGTAVSSLSIGATSNTLTGFYGVQIIANTTAATVYQFFGFNVINPASPDVSFSTVPNNNLIITPGSLAPIYLQLDSINGFSGTLELAYTGNNAGITVNPSSLNVTLSAQGTAIVRLAIAVALNAPRGNTCVGMTATNGTFNRGFCLSTFVAAPDINPAPKDTSFTIQAGVGTATTTFTIASLDGLQGTVSMKAAVQPCFNGICPSVSFSPPNPSVSPGGWTLSNMTVSAPLGTAPGSYTIVVNATSGVVSHITYLTVNVTPSNILVPDFSIFVNPSFLTIAQGGQASSVVSLTSVNGFKGNVALTAAVPSGFTGALGSQTLSLKSGGLNSTNLSLLVASTTLTGFYTVVVTATNGTITRSVNISVQVVGADFSISANPTLVTVPQGKSGISTITLTSIAGFAGTVNLSVSGNLAASFNKSSVALSSGGTASSNLTISGFTTVPGLYYLTVSAFSGTVSHFITVVANVTGPDFRITASPSNLAIVEGKSGFSTITLTGSLGFSGPILITASNYYSFPPFLTSVNPSSVTLNSTVTTMTVSLNVTVPANIVPGSFNYVVVTGSNGILSHTIFILVTVTGPDFSLGSNPSFINVHQGKNATSTVSLASLDGFHGTVNIGTTASAGLSVSLNSTVTLSTGGTANAILSISTTNATTLGGHFVQISATSGFLQHSTTVYVNVTGPDFSISASPFSFTLLRGQNANSTITLHSVDGFIGTVKLALASSGLAASLNATSVSLSPTKPATLTLSIPINGTVHNGFYFLSVTGTSGILSHSTFIDVNVVGPDFSISGSPTFLDLQRGQTGLSTITLSSFYGFSGNVTLSILPTGSTGTLDKTSVKLVAGGTATATLTVTIPAQAPGGGSRLYVQAVSGNLTRTTFVDVFVTVITPDFNIGVVPFSQTLLAGSTGNYAIILTSLNSFSGTVSLNSTSANGFTTSLSAQKLTIPAGGQVSANLAVTVPANTLTGDYDILVTATNSSGTPTHTAFVVASVLAQNFTITASPSFLSFPADSSGKSIVNAIGLNGFAGTMQLSLTFNNPQLRASLATTSLIINSGFANSTVLTVSSTTGTAPGFYQVVVNGTIGSISRSVTVTVDVTPSQIQPTSTTVACSTPIKVNNASTCTATVMSTATIGVTTPTGRVDFATNSTSSFFTPYCFLSVTGTTGLARCSVEYTPTVIGHILVTGTYAGDITHSGSSGNFTLSSIPNVVVQISGPRSGNAGSPLAFTAFVSGGVLPFTFSWAALGGSPSTGSTVGFTTTYPTAGRFRVNVNATDANGNSGTASAGILIFPSSGQKLSLTVLVFNATATPIQGSTVVAANSTTTNSSTTDATGSSVFTLSPGIYNVTASASGYLSTSQIVDLVSNQTITVTLSNPYLFLGQIPASHLTIKPVTGGFTITLINMFTSSQSNVVFDWHFMGTIPANGTVSFFFDHLPQLIVESAAKGSVDYPNAWYALPLPPGLNVTTGQEGAFLPEANPYDASSIFIIPNPPVAGQNTQIGVVLHNPFNHTLTISRIDFQVATLNIGASTWASVGQISNVTLAVGETRTFSVNWVATLASHLCVRVVLHYLPSGIQVLQKNLVILNTKSVTFTLGDPFGSGGDFTLAFGGGGDCVANINGQLVTSTITLHLAAGAQITITLSGNCNIGEYFGGSLIGGAVTIATPLPDVEIICPPDGFVGQPVTCSANVSGDISVYTILWSTDGTPSTGTDSIFTTVYSTPGLHTVTVTLSSGGQSVTKSAQIMIFGNSVTVGSSVIVSSPGVTGAIAHDTATMTLANATATAPTGNLRYDFYPTADCSGTANSQTVSLGGNGSVPNSSSHGPLATGSYSFKATYLGDSIYQSSSSSCESFTINKAPTTVATQVMNAGTGLAPSGDEITGASFDDTATLKGSVAGFTATGTVTYQLYSTKDCSGTSSALPDVTLNTDGSVPASTSTGALHAGDYSFAAAYNGDSNYLKSPASGCESFTVHRAPTTVTTQVVNNANGLAPFGTEVTGSSFRDTAMLGGAITGFTPTGSITYTLYANSACAGTLVSPSQTVTLTATGSVPDSNTSGPLAAGNYRYQAIYSGDRDYLPSPPSPCETLKVLKAPTTTATTLINAATGGLPNGTEVTGSSFNDNATIFGAIVGFTPSGSVRYQFWTNNSCTGTISTSEILSLNAMGGAPTSSATRRLGAGNYSFQADYSGDSNYLPSQSTCENFTVLKAPTITHTQVISGATGKPPTGTEVAGNVFFDTATVIGINGFTTAGTVQYQFFTNANCSGSRSTNTVILSNGFVPNSTATVPLAAGGYSYTAVYSGDGNYTGSTSSGPTCESFNVAKIKPTVTTTLTPAGNVFAGQSVIDLATFGPNTTFQPTGSLTYSLTPSGTCTGQGGRVVATVNLSSGSIPDSGSVPLIQAGTFGFNATYSGDANNLHVTSSCETITVIKATPTIATSLSPSVIVARSSAFDTATLSGTSGSTSAGIVTYFVFTTSSGTSTGGCIGTPHTVSVVNVANSAVPISRSVLFNRTGTYGWDAVYSGDANNNGATSSCETLTVTNAGGVFFNLTASTRSVMVPAGTIGTSTITLNSFNGFGRPVTLSFTISPTTGLTCTLSRTRITGGSGSSTLTCSGSTEVYGVTVTGLGGPYTSSVMVTFNVTSTVGPLVCGTGCSIFILSDAVLSNLASSATSMGFTATGLVGTTVFANVTIPLTAVPDITALTVSANGSSVQPIIVSDGISYYVYFTFKFTQSTTTVNIQL